MPEPTTAKLVDKKTAAYEKQQAEVEEESRMKSLEQLVGKKFSPRQFTQADVLYTFDL